MIARFSDFLAAENLTGQVELKGSFCMERCGDGINWQISDEIFSSASVDEGAEMFQKKVLELLNEEAQQESPDGGKTESS